MLESTTGVLNQTPNSPKNVAVNLNAASNDPRALPPENPETSPSTPPVASSSLASSSSDALEPPARQPSSVLATSKLPLTLPEYKQKAEILRSVEYGRMCKTQVIPTFDSPGALKSSSGYSGVSGTSTSSTLTPPVQKQKAPFIRRINHGHMCNTQVVTALDCSASMKNSLQYYKDFFEKPANFQKIVPEKIGTKLCGNESFLICFAGKNVYRPEKFLTQDDINWQTKLIRAYLGGDTPLFTSISAALDYLQMIQKPNKVQQLHIHTDGEDTEFSFLKQNNPQRWIIAETERRSRVKEKMWNFLKQNPQNIISFYSYMHGDTKKNSSYYFDEHGRPSLREFQAKFPGRFFVQKVLEKEGEDPTKQLTNTTQLAALPKIIFNIDHQPLNPFQQSIYYCHLYNSPLKLIEELGLTKENYQEKFLAIGKQELSEAEKLALITATETANSEEIISIIESRVI